MITVLLDTNFILYVLENHIPLSRLEEVLDAPFSLATVPAVKKELSKLASSRGKKGIIAKVALDLNIPVVDAEGAYADEQLLSALKESSVLATNDVGLAKRAKKKGNRVVMVGKKGFRLY